jgi:hypothetical protein
VYLSFTSEGDPSRLGAAARREPEARTKQKPSPGFHDQVPFNIKKGIKKFFKRSSFNTALSAAMHSDPTVSEETRIESGTVATYCIMTVLS